MAEFERIEKIPHLRIFTHNIKICKFMISCCEEFVSHCFPREPKRRAEWIIKIRRDPGPQFQGGSN